MLNKDGVKHGLKGYEFVKSVYVRNESFSAMFDPDDGKPQV